MFCGKRQAADNADSPVLVCRQSLPLRTNPPGARRRHADKIMRATKTLLIGVVVFVGSDRGARALWRRRPLQELRRMGCRAIVTGRASLACRPLGRVSADLGLQLDDIDEYISLATQLVCNHRRLRRYGRDHSYANPSALYGFDKRAEIAVTREEHHV